MGFFGYERALICNDVVAGLAAGWTVKETVLAEPDFNLRLAKAAELFALALVFRHLALHAAIF